MSIDAEPIVVTIRVAPSSSAWAWYLVQGARFDLQYARKWANELSVAELLERAVVEAALDG